MENEIKCLRGFGLEYKDSKTRVEIAEFSDGSIGISISTKRENLEPLTTRFRIAPQTFSILSEAIIRAAHDPTVWSAN